MLCLLLVGCNDDSMELEVGKCYKSTPENKYDGYRKFVFEEGYTLSYNIRDNKLTAGPDLIEDWHKYAYNEEVKCPKFTVNVLFEDDYKQMGILNKLKPYLKEENE